MIKDLGIKTGTRIVQTDSSDQDVKRNTELKKESPTKTQLGIGSVSYGSEYIKQQLGPVEVEVKSLVDQIKEQRLAEQAERSDVQQQQDMMGEMNKANQQSSAMSKSSFWSDIFRFFSS